MSDTVKCHIAGCRRAAITRVTYPEFGAVPFCGPDYKARFGIWPTGPTMPPVTTKVREEVLDDGSVPAYGGFDGSRAPTRSTGIARHKNTTRRSD